MITKENYLNQNFNTNDWPEQLKAGHNFITSSSDGYRHIDLYDDDETIKEAIDKHLQLLNNYLSKKPSSKAKKQPVAKPAKSKSSANAEQVESLPLEVQIIKRYVGYDGKNKSCKQVMQLLDFIQKAIIEKKVRKVNPHASQVDELQKLLIKKYNSMLDKGSNSEPFEIESNRKKRLQAIVEKYGKIGSVALIKRYIALDGEYNADGKSKADRLLHDVERYLSKNPEDKYKSALRSILAELKKSHPDGFKINEMALAGLPWVKLARKALHLAKKGKDAAAPHVAKIGRKISEKSSEIYKKIDDKLAQKESLSGVNDLFVDPVKTVDPTKLITLNSDLGQFMGKLEKKELGITIEGPKGTKKTQLSYQLLDKFAEKGLKSAGFNLELPTNSLPLTNFRNQYIKPEHENLIKWADTLPNGIDTIRAIAPNFDIVFIDSWNATGISSDGFKNLLKEFPETIFIAIFQMTSNGQTRGGNAPMSWAGINIETRNEGTDQTSIATYSKNRYNPEVGLRYNIVAQILI